MKTWGRRFAARREDPLLESFNASIREDRFLAAQEIEASLGYARALRRAGVLSAQEAARIKTGLAAVRGRIDRGLDLGEYEDIHSAVELMLIREIGAPGQKLHTGRSRNEQVVTDERLYLKGRVPRLVRLLTDCQRAVIRLAERHAGAVMPGYTHLRQAQAVLFSHYVMSLFWPLERAKARLREALKRIDVLPLGSGALAGTTVPLDRDFLRRALRFAAVSENSMDAVADRSFILEPLSALLILFTDLSRFAEDFIILSGPEFGFLALDDAITTSSSLMPQKKNPDLFELLRTAPARIFGDFGRLVLTLKGLPSTYDKDLQDDKVPLHRGVEEAIRLLRVFRVTLGLIRPRPSAIARKLDPFLFATDLVDYLTVRGVPFREAHGLVGEIVRFAETKGRALDALTLPELQGFHASFAADVFKVFDPGRSVRLKRTSGSTHPAEVKKQIRKAKRIVSIPA